MLKIQQLKGAAPRFGLYYALLSSAGCVAHVGAGNRDLIGEAAARAARDWTRKLAAVDDLIDALRKARAEIDGSKETCDGVIGTLAAIDSALDRAGVAQ